MGGGRWEGGGGRGEGGGGRGEGGGGEQTITSHAAKVYVLH